MEMVSHQPDNLHQPPHGLPREKKKETNLFTQTARRIMNHCKLYPTQKMVEPLKTSKTKRTYNFINKEPQEVGGGG
jgi:hypothetical protein